MGGRRNKKERVYRVRTKKKKSVFRSALFTGRRPRDAGDRSKSRNRIISVTKIGMEELLKVGDFFRLGPQLMREIREEERQARIAKERENGIPSKASNQNLNREVT